VTAPETRPLRADARLNHDRLLEAAACVFLRDGAQASLKTIAKEAGVGIGTLYRRFPSRERLVEAMYRHEVARMCATAEVLLAAEPPARALRSWMTAFVAFFATKQGMVAVLRVVLGEVDDMKTETHRLLVDALTTLLDAAAREGSVRTDVTAEDLFLSLSGIGMVTAQVGPGSRSERLLDLQMDALRVIEPRTTSTRRPPAD
jgi:AcrR family transcriptional regulator